MRARRRAVSRRLCVAASRLLPLALSLSVWLPLLFLAGGSLMGFLELRELLGPVLEGREGFAVWRALPRYPTLRPYVELLLDSPAFFVMFWNSVRLTAGTLAGQLAVAVPAAWWFARRNTGGSHVLFTLYTVLMLMPFQVTMVGGYLVMDRAHLLDTGWSVLLPAVFSTFPVFIVYRFFREIPAAVVEAAWMDGADGYRVFRLIGIPLGKAGIASALVLGFLESWNLMEQPMTFLRTKSRWPLSLFLPQITGEQAGLALAASVLTLIPSLLVFLIGQADLEQGIVASSVKE